MRLIIVSNRLPITAVIEEGKFVFQESAGGLVSGIGAYLESLKESSFARPEYIWFGWPGITVDEGLREELKCEIMNKFHAYPVFMTEKVMDMFYLGFCNKIIWPLFHYFPSIAVYDEDYWIQYKQVNETFCKAILEIVKPGDVVWVHDYHLMLLPHLLRQRMPDALIGFFLHIPFPSVEVFSLLPSKWRGEILEGLLGADLIGFHTYDYTQYFLRCVLRILGYEHNMGQIIAHDRVIHADTFPMGIDFQKYSSATKSSEVQKIKEELKRTLSDFKVILSVDRLDYTKGIIHRLRGYETFLEKYPQWQGKVVLIMVVVPSRIGVEDYQSMKRQIDEIVGNINGKFGDIHWTPILYQYRFLSFQPLVALYQVSDVALITPLRDGMNLIAKEYVSARVDKTGVLILSEMAGASKELGESIIINPNNREEIANAIKDALEMPVEDQMRRNEIMQMRLERYNVVRWAEDFTHKLTLVKEEQKHFNATILSHSMKEHLLEDFRKAKRKLILSDYDGTLIPFAKYPHMAKPTDKLMSVLGNLSKRPDTEVVIISGRDKNTLQDWFGVVNIGLVAEHGVWIKERHHNWKLLKPLVNDWKPKIFPILNTYVDCVPGSFIEEKEFSVAWHYRKADPEQGSIRAKELVDNLVEFTANIDIQVLQGNKVVEVRNVGINKGTAALHWIAKDAFDFIMAIGDDQTDEDMFMALPGTAYTIRVGLTQSHARFNLPRYHHVEVISLFDQMAKA